MATPLSQEMNGHEVQTNLTDARNSYDTGLLVIQWQFPMLFWFDSSTIAHRDQRIRNERRKNECEVEMVLKPVENFLVN